MTKSASCSDAICEQNINLTPGRVEYICMICGKSVCYADVSRTYTNTYVDNRKSYIKLCLPVDLLNSSDYDLQLVTPPD